MREKYATVRRVSAGAEGYVVDYLLAYLFGIAFQFYSIKPIKLMKGLSVDEGIEQAVKSAM